MPIVNRLRNFFILTAVEGLLVFLYLLTVPSESSSSTLLGYSPTRLLVIFGVLIANITLIWLAWRTHKNITFQSNLVNRLRRVLSENRVYITTLIILGGIFLSSYYLFILAFQISDNLVRVRLERLQPILLWSGLISAQLLAFLPIIKFGQDRETPNDLIDLKQPWLMTLIAGFSGFFLILVTRLGLEPDKVGWDNAGAPVLAIQLLGIVIIAVALWCLSINLPKKVKGTTADKLRVSRLVNFELFIGLIIWVTATFLWAAEPLTPTYFSPHPRAPNFEYYPYSDASLHDRAGQNLIIGEGYNAITEKPLYSLFLGFSHILVGQDYAKVINLQIAVLALFPVMVYLLATKFHHRLTGLLAAGFIIVRESNTIALSPLIRVSHSKLLMTDLPAAFLMAIFMLILFAWLSKRPNELSGAVIAGGALGVTLMVRSQAILLIPVVIGWTYFINRISFKSYLIRSGMFVFGAMVIILPWMLRDYQMTGVFGYSQPQQALYIAKQYNLTPQDDDPGFPEGTNSDEYTSLGFQKMIEFIKTYPMVVANFVSSHFIQNEISTLFMFPATYTDVSSNNGGENLFDVDPFVWQECCSLLSFVETNPFWVNWSGSLSSGLLFAGVINISLISLGIAYAWQRWRFLGLLPLVIHFSYSFSVAIARVSGWRLILPVDWIVTIYFCVGLATSLLLILKYIFGNKDIYVESGPDKLIAAVSPKNSRASYKNSVITAVVFLIIGISIPVAEGLFPQKYEPVAKDVVLELLYSLAPAETKSLESQSILNASNVTAFTGRLLYPRFYLAEEEELGGRWEGSAYNYNRLSFYLAGPNEGFVVLNLEYPPYSVPNGSDVVFLGCNQGNHIVAYAVVILGEDGENILINDKFSLNVCE